MTGEDVREEHGVWLIDIGPGRRRKTGSSVRRVPLHPALIAEGFIAYAATKGPSVRLFPVNADQNVARWVREKVGITDQTKDPSHAWRHWFEDEGRAAGIPEEIRDALAGHANTSIGRQYGNGYSAYRDPRLMKRLAEAVATIAVPGVSLSLSPGPPRTPTRGWDCPIRPASCGLLQIAFFFRQCLGQQRIEQAAACVLAGGEGRLQPVTQRHQFIDLGDDAALLGEGWQGNQLQLVIAHRQSDLSTIVCKP